MMPTLKKRKKNESWDALCSELCANIWATQTTFMLNDWLKDTFSAHSLLLPNKC